jgi:hypothetical protein
MCTQSQLETAKVYHEVGTGDPIEGERIVQFRLLYSGTLLGASKTNTRAELKHEIRKEISPQLQRFWQTSSTLREFSRHKAHDWGERHPEFREELRPGLPIGYPENWTEDELSSLGRRYLAEKWERFGQGFIPLITEDMCLRSTIEVLFLRPEDAGMLIRSGDLDNRIKTLFDALRLPQNLDEAGGKRGNSDDPPIYCLLEDDKLISEIRIITDHLLLLPSKKEVSPNDVFLVIDVKIQRAAKHAIRMGVWVKGRHDSR